MPDIGVIHMAFQYYLALLKFVFSIIDRPCISQGDCTLYGKLFLYRISLSYPTFHFYD